MFRISRFENPYIQFLLTLLISFAILSVLVFLALPIADKFFGPGSSEILTSPNYKDLTKLPLYQYFQLIQSFGLFVIPPFVLAFLFSNSAMKYLGINKSINYKQFFTIGVIIFGSLPLINLLANYNSGIKLPEWMVPAPVKEFFNKTEKEAEAATDLFLWLRNIKGLIFNLFMVALVPAIGEELMFRGVLQNIFSKMARNEHAGIIIAAALFSAIHLQFSGFIPRMLLGMIFGYLVLWSGSIWSSVLAHFINNALAVIGYFMVNRGAINKSTMDVGITTDNTFYTVIFTAFFIIGCYNFHKLCVMREKKNQPTQTS